MSVNYEDLKIGGTYFITDPETEKVQETILVEVHLSRDSKEDKKKLTVFSFKYYFKDEAGEDCAHIWVKIKDGKEVFDGEFVKIEVYKTREEAENNRARILIAGHEAFIEDLEKDILKFEEKIKELKAVDA